MFFTVTFKRRRAMPAPLDRVAIGRGMLAARRALQAHLPADLLHDPSIDMLVTLFIAHADGISMGIAELATTTSVGPAVARRWIKALQQYHLVEHRADEVLALTKAGLAAVTGAIGAVGEAQQAQRFVHRPRLRLLSGRNQRPGVWAVAPELAAAG